MFDCDEYETQSKSTNFDYTEDARTYHESHGSTQVGWSVQNIEEKE